MSRVRRGSNPSDMTPLIDPATDDPTLSPGALRRTASAAVRSGSLNSDKKEEPKKENTRALVISFVAMVVVGLGNKIFQVLELIPMVNYPIYVNLITSFVYIPCSFAYIFPMIKYGKLITPEALAVPKYKFLIMGTLDSIAGVMQTLAVNYIANGSLVILLSQAAIPLSMVITKIFIPTKYKMSQYFGALVVAAGLIVVLFPSFAGKQHSNGDGPDAKTVIIWSIVMALSCVPMCLSSVYKEKALGETEIDAVYLNGWVALFQFFISFPLLFPTAPAANLSIDQLPDNIWGGMKCMVGINTITNSSITPHMASLHIKPDDCAKAPLFVSIYMIFNLGYNVLIILILKFGSSNVLWLSMTVMVPLGNLAFALDFVPGHHPLKPTDIAGLVTIMTGLITYRFFSPLRKALFPSKTDDPDDPNAVESMLSTPTRGTTIHTTHGATQRKNSKGLTEDQMRLIYGDEAGTSA